MKHHYMLKTLVSVIAVAFFALGYLAGMLR